MSSTFTAFCRELDISHILTSAYHHQSNPAELAIRTVKQIMCKCIETGNPWHLGLLEYLCTLISDQIPSPSELLNRRYRGVQPFLHFTPSHSTELKPFHTKCNVLKVNQVHQNAPPPPSPPKQEPSTSTVIKMPPVTTTRAGHVVKPPTKMNL